MHPDRINVVLVAPAGIDTAAVARLIDRTLREHGFPAQLVNQSPAVRSDDAYLREIGESLDKVIVTTKVGRAPTPFMRRAKLHLVRTSVEDTSD